MNDPQSNERAIKRHWFDQQIGTDQERLIDSAIDREFEEMGNDEKIKAKRDWQRIFEGTNLDQRLVDIAKKVFAKRDTLRRRLAKSET